MYECGGLASRCDVEDAIAELQELPLSTHLSMDFAPSLSVCGRSSIKTTSKERLAEELGMSSRTLQRKLNEEGAQYQEILDELRLEMATQFFSRKELSLDEIARKLGYLETRSFYRGFKQWTGKTVGEYRKGILPGS